MLSTEKDWQVPSFDESCIYTEESVRRDLPVGMDVIVAGSNDKDIEGVTGHISGYYGGCWVVVTLNQSLPNGDECLVILASCVEEV